MCFFLRICTQKKTIVIGDQYHMCHFSVSVSYLSLTYSTFILGYTFDKYYPGGPNIPRALSSDISTYSKILCPIPLVAGISNNCLIIVSVVIDVPRFITQLFALKTFLLENVLNVYIPRTWAVCK